MSIVVVALYQTESPLFSWIWFPVFGTPWKCDFLWLLLVGRAHWVWLRVLKVSDVPTFEVCLVLWRTRVLRRGFESDRACVEVEEEHLVVSTGLLNRCYWGARFPVRSLSLFCEAVWSVAAVCSSSEWMLLASSWLICLLVGLLRLISGFIFEEWLSVDFWIVMSLFWVTYLKS